MAKTKVHITQGIIDAVFSDPKLQKKFPDPDIAKAICEMRLGCTPYTVIAMLHGVSQWYCCNIVHKVVRLYNLFC